MLFTPRQKLGKLKFLISQKVENLPLKSGIRSELIAELHVNMTKLRCVCPTTLQHLGCYREAPQRFAALLSEKDRIGNQVISDTRAHQPGEHVKAHSGRQNL